eukprot:56107-Eustigmatos_ZCMA.PRE.1
MLHMYHAVDVIKPTQTYSSLKSKQDRKAATSIVAVASVVARHWCGATSSGTTFPRGTCFTSRERNAGNRHAVPASVLKIVASLAWRWPYRDIAQSEPIPWLSSPPFPMFRRLHRPPSTHRSLHVPMQIDIT